MVQWEVNKDVGRVVKFKGLKAQHFFPFIGGLLAVFFLMVALYLCGIGQIAYFGPGSVGITLVVWQTSAMNREYGRYGLTKQGVIKIRPRYLLNRRAIFRLIHNLKPKRKVQ